MGKPAACSYQPKKRKRCVNLLAAPLCHIHVFRPISPSCIATVPGARCICLTSSHFFFKSSSSFILIGHNSLRLRKKNQKKSNPPCSNHPCIYLSHVCVEYSPSPSPQASLFSSRGENPPDSPCSILSIVRSAFPFLNSDPLSPFLLNNPPVTLESSGGVGSKT